MFKPSKKNLTTEAVPTLFDVPNPPPRIGTKRRLLVREDPLNKTCKKNENSIYQSIFTKDTRLLEIYTLNFTKLHAFILHILRFKIKIPFHNYNSEEKKKTSKPTRAVKKMLPKQCPR